MSSATPYPIIQSVREAIRRRVVPSIFAVGEYQREGFPAPDADLYVRETLVSLDKTEDFQGSIKEQFLAQFDVYARRSAFPQSVVSQLYTYGEKLCAEFDPRDSAKVDLTLTGWSGVSAFVDRLPAVNSVSQETELFGLPVLVYITIIRNNRASH